MKRSPLVRQRNKAEEILKKVLKEREQFEIRMYALLYLIDCLLIKLENTTCKNINVRNWVNRRLDYLSKMIERETRRDEEHDWGIY